MPATDMFATRKDNDTLAGRLTRARDAAGITTAQLAKSLGVKKATLEAWEADRSEPRSSRINMLSGILNVSPTWLLHGVGNSPLSETISDELHILRGRLAQLRDLHEKTGELIVSIGNSIDRLEAREGD